jgi:hypothetical protein
MRIIEDHPSCKIVTEVVSHQIYHLHMSWDGRGSAISDSLICPAMMFSAAFFNLFLDLAPWSQARHPLDLDTYFAIKYPLGN